MKKTGIRHLCAGTTLLFLFVLWTVLICTVDVRPAGQAGTSIGFAALNLWFHRLTGVHMTLYHITDWLGLVPVAVCMGFATLGLVQLLRRKKLLRVDRDLLLLGVYYVLVILAYLLFEEIPINYRPVLIDGFLEASYPSSTTLLVLSVMPTLPLQMRRRCKNHTVHTVLTGATAAFSLFTVFGRLISGVHWLTDILGSVLLCAGLFLLYQSSIELLCSKK